MVTFLASSPTKELCPDCPEPALNEQNGFVELLREEWREDARCLMIAAFPDAYEQNDEMAGHYQAAVENAGLPVACFDLWDSRCPGLSWEELHEYDVIFLSGGHVPREHEWFEYIELRELLEGYEGIVVGTSAGSMNAAETVYAWPEEEGESEDPEYERFFDGLGLAKTMILPHYQKVKDGYLDGKRLIGDIARGDSYGCCFLAIPDGSYVLVRDGEETVFGEAYLIADGEISEFCGEDSCRACSGFS